MKDLGRLDGVKDLSALGTPDLGGNEEDRVVTLVAGGDENDAIETTGHGSGSSRRRVTVKKGRVRLMFCVSTEWSSQPLLLLLSVAVGEGNKNKM